MPDSRVRIVSLNPDLRHAEKSRGPILYEWERTFARAAAGEGLEYVIFGGLEAVPPADFAVPVIPTFAEGTELSYDPGRLPDAWRHAREFSDRVLWSFDRLRASEATSALRHVFLLYNGHPAHIAALIRLGLALGGTSPIVLNLYHLHLMWGPDVSFGPGPQLRELLAGTRGLRRAANLHLRADSRRLADVLEQETGEAIEVLPFFSVMGDHVEQRMPRQAGRPIRVVYPTAVPSTGKGFDLVVGLAERLGRPDVEIVGRAPARETWEVCLPTLAALRGGLRLIESFLPGASYQELLRSADVVLVPYRRWQFFARTSSVVSDAIGLDVPLVGPKDTWIGDQIEQSGSGTTFPDGDVDGLVEAVRHSIDALTSTHERERDPRAAWLERNNLRAFWRAVVGAGDMRRKRPDLFTAVRLMRLAALTHVGLPVRSALRGARAALARRTKALCAGRSGELALAYTSEEEAPPGRPAIFGLTPAIQWKTRGVKAVELRLDRPDGFLINRGGPCGDLSSIVWIDEGRRVFLQDVSNERPLLPAHTLDSIRFRYRPDDHAGRTSAPSRLSVALLPVIRALRSILGLGNGRLAVSAPALNARQGVTATVSWSCRPGAAVSVHVGAANGLLFAATAGPSVKETGPWVIKGTAFVLLDSRRYTPWFLRLMDVYIVTGEPPSYPITRVRRRWRDIERIFGWGDPPLRSWPPRMRAQWAVLPLLQGLRRGLGLPTGQLRATVRHDPVAATVSWRREPAGPIEMRADGTLLAREHGTEGTIALGPWACNGASILLRDGSRRRLPSLLRLLDITAVPPTLHLLPRAMHGQTAGSAVKRSLASAVGPREWGIVPDASSGELFLVTRYSRTILERFGGDRLVVFGRRGQITIGRLFRHAPVTLRDRDEYDLDVFRDGANIGRVFALQYGPAKLIGRRQGARLGFAHLLLEEIGVSLDSPAIEPRVPEDVRDAARQRFRELGLIEGRTVFVAPLSYSWKPNPWRAWLRIVEGLDARGFRLATNCGPSETPVPGTVAWHGDLAELYSGVEIGGFLLTARSGLADLCSTANTHLHILHRDSDIAYFPGVIVLPRLGDNGLPDRAVYHVQAFDEDPLAFADRVLAHPDFA